MIYKIIDFIQNPIKTAIATVTGAVTGQMPELLTSEMSNFDTNFQRCVWTLTIILGILGIIGAIQKQIDRFRNRHNRHKNNFNNDFYE